MEQTKSEKGANDLKSEARTAAVDRAKRFAGDDDDEAAEREISADNRSSRGSAGWHLETANGLTQLAFSLSRSGQPEKAVRVARRALVQLELTARKAERPALAAAVEETAAMIYERLLSDYDGAKERYKKAARLNPDGDAGKELERVEKREREAARKSSRNH